MNAFSEVVKLEEKRSSKQFIRAETLGPRISEDQVIRIAGLASNHGYRLEKSNFWLSKSCVASIRQSATLVLHIGEN